MRIQLIVGAFAVTRKYFALLKKHPTIEKSLLYKNAAEAVRSEYFPEYGEDFIGDVRKTWCRIKKDGTSKKMYHMHIDEHLNYDEIDHRLNQEESTVVQKSTQTTKEETEEEIALYHLKCLGGIGNEDTMSHKELELLQIPLDEKEEQILPLKQKQRFFWKQLALF